MNYLETAVTVEKDIEELGCLDKFAKYILLCTYYHLSRSENNVDFSNCTFNFNFDYLYAENLIGGNIENLQKYSSFHYCSFFTLRTMLQSLAEIEREKLALEKKFEKVLKLWNVKNINLPFPPKEGEKIEID